MFSRTIYAHAIYAVSQHGQEHSVGQMAEHIGSRELFKDKHGNEGDLNFRETALSEILQDLGYLTILFRKWSEPL